MCVGCCGVWLILFSGRLIDVWFGTCLDSEYRCAIHDMLSACVLSSSTPSTDSDTRDDRPPVRHGLASLQDTTTSHGVRWASLDAVLHIGVAIGVPSQISALSSSYY